MAHNWTWSTELQIPSETGSGRRVLDDLLAQLNAHGWTEDDVFAIHLSVEEALVNAIKHGNKHDATKQVDVSCRVSKERMWIEITDEGAGFNEADVPDPTLEENLEAPSGRGLMLMRNFMTRVEFSEGGTRVTMEKTRKSE